MKCHLQGHLLTVQHVQDIATRSCTTECTVLYSSIMIQTPAQSTGLETFSGQYFLLIYASSPPPPLRPIHQDSETPQPEDTKTRTTSCDTCDEFNPTTGCVEEKAILHVAEIVLSISSGRAKSRRGMSHGLCGSALGTIIILHAKALGTLIFG
jgi:hypothetical protein